MLQVLTNSSTCLGRSVICVSRSLQWMTFTPSRAGKVVEAALGDAALDLLGPAPLDLAVGDQALADVDQALLGEVRDQAGVGAVLDHRRRPLLLPLGGHPPDVHVAPVERALGRMLVGPAGVRIPQLGRGVDVEHAVVVAPLQDLAGVDVPGQVDQQVARRQMLAQQRGPDCPACTRSRTKRTPEFGPGPQLRRAVLEIHDRDVCRRNLDQLEEDRQRALGHRAVADEEDFFGESDHGSRECWRRKKLAPSCAGNPVR